MQVLLLSMSAHITKQLGMAPGGEFRAAYKEVLLCTILVHLPGQDCSKWVKFIPGLSKTYTVVAIASLGKWLRFLYYSIMPKFTYRSNLCL